MNRISSKEESRNQSCIDDKKFPDIPKLNIPVNKNVSKVINTNIIINEKNEIVDTERYERQEQELAKQYILENDIVLELGARYGSVSCIINSKLNNKLNQVVVEPDERVWGALEKNKKNNNCKFHIINGFISNKKLELINHNVCYGYGTTSVINNNSTIPSYTLDEVINKYNLNFNVLVADCEGFLEIFFDENPNFYDQLRLIIFESDYQQKCNYNIIKSKLLEKNFTKILEGIQNVWIKY